MDGTFYVSSDDGKAYKFPKTSIIRALIHKQWFGSHDLITSQRPLPLNSPLGDLVSTYGYFAGKQTLRTWTIQFLIE